MTHEKREIELIVKCVGCGHRRAAEPGRLEQPMCERCFMPMVPDATKVRKAQ